MRITVQLDRIREDGCMENLSRIAHYELNGLETYRQVYECCERMIMEHIDSDYCYMHIYLWGEPFMDVDLLALRWAVEG